LNTTYRLYYKNQKLFLGPPKWHGGLRHCIAVLESSLQIRVRSQAVLQPAATGRTMRWRTIVLASSGLGVGLAGWDVLVPSRARDFLRPGACMLTSGRQLYGVSSDILVRLSSRLSEQCVKKQCGLVGSVSVLCVS
jgi:hypothetical protein